MRRRRPACRGDASAYQYYGVYQYASNNGTGVASNTVTNNGTMNITAKASATARTRSRMPMSPMAIYQDAYADQGNASNTVTNAGTLNIDASAKASATSGSASAYALRTKTPSTNMRRRRTATPSNTVNNTGTLNIDASAVADGTSLASATAYNYYAISQTAYADHNNDASNSVTNAVGGTIDIGAKATAKATGVTGNANAYAYVYEDVNSICLLRPAPAMPRTSFRTTVR